MILSLNSLGSHMRVHVKYVNVPPRNHSDRTAVTVEHPGVSAPTEEPEPEPDTLIRSKALVIDAMGEVQCINKKDTSLGVIADFSTVFLKRIINLVHATGLKEISQSDEGEEPDELRLVFDPYCPRDDSHSLKTQTRRKRNITGAIRTYQLHENMSIKNIALKDLLSTESNKHQLTDVLAKAVLTSPDLKLFRVIVTWHHRSECNQPGFTSIPHNHEEADTLIPKHVMHCLEETTVKDVTVVSPDTDVLVLLIDLVANGNGGPLTKLRMSVGKGKRQREINVVDRVRKLGGHAKAILGWYMFKGADWGGKFAGISTNKWMLHFLTRSDEAILDAFVNLGEEYFETVPDSLYQPLSTCVTRVYGGSRWELFKSKNLKLDGLPPTKGVLIPHCLRANYATCVAKSYRVWVNDQPSMVGRGWQESSDGAVYAVMNINPAAPEAVMNVIKCNCKLECGGRCSCLRNKLSCTSMCGCSCDKAVVEPDDDLHYKPDEVSDDSDSD